MRTALEWLCDTPDAPGCQRDANVASMCQVEGREFALCRSCQSLWKNRVSADPAMAVRCPNCLPSYLRTEAIRKDNATPPKDRPAPLTGSVADALDHAMFMDGILPDVRHRVLCRLAAEAAWLGDAVRLSDLKRMNDLMSAIGNLSEAEFEEKVREVSAA